jgi:hypothetical protein
MDFVEGKDTILVVVDRFTVYVHFMINRREVAFAVGDQVYFK